MNPTFLTLFKAQNPHLFSVAIYCERLEMDGLIYVIWHFWSNITPKPLYRSGELELLWTFRISAEQLTTIVSDIC